MRRRRWRRSVIPVNYTLNHCLVEIADGLANGLFSGLSRRSDRDGAARLRDIGANGGLDGIIAKAALLFDAHALLGRLDIRHR